MIVDKSNNFEDSDSSLEDSLSNGSISNDEKSMSAFQAHRKRKHKYPNTPESV